MMQLVAAPNKYIVCEKFFLGGNCPIAPLGLRALLRLRTKVCKTHNNVLLRVLPTKQYLGNTLQKTI